MRPLVLRLVTLQPLRCSRNIGKRNPESETKKCELYTETNLARLFFTLTVSTVLLY